MRLLVNRALVILELLLLLAGSTFRLSFEDTETLCEGHDGLLERQLLTLADVLRAGKCWTQMLQQLSVSTHTATTLPSSARKLDCKPHIEQQTAQQAATTAVWKRPCTL